MYKTLATKLQNVHSKKGQQVPVDPPSVFTAPHSFSLQSLDATAALRNVKSRNVEAESRLKVIQSYDGCNPVW